MSDAQVKKTKRKPTGAAAMGPGPGRPKGCPNKMPAALKETILRALDKAGGVDYLADQAVSNPQAFLALLGKALPQDVRATIGAFPLTAEQADRVVNGD